MEYIPVTRGFRQLFLLLKRVGQCRFKNVARGSSIRFKTGRIFIHLADMANTFDEMTALFVTFLKARLIHLCLKINK